jgi:hypothetical protein
MSRIKVRSLNVSYPPHYIGNRYGTLPSVSTVPACPNSIDVQVFKSELTNKKREQLNKFFYALRSIYINVSNLDSHSVCPLDTNAAKGSDPGGGVVHKLQIW